MPLPELQLAGLEGNVEGKRQEVRELQTALPATTSYRPGAGDSEKSQL